MQTDKITLFSDLITSLLSIPCSSLSGANIANEVALDSFSETTIGCKSLADGKKWFKVFNTKQFRVSLTDDVRGVGLAGALKNVVAVAAGFVDGLGWGNNAKAAVMRWVVLHFLTLKAAFVLMLNFLS